MERVENTEEAVADGPWWSTPDQQARVLAHSAGIRDNDIEPLQELRTMLVGPHFGGGVGDESVEKPTNSTYGFYARYHGEVLGGDLKCRLRADPGSPEEPIALAYEAIANEIYDRNNSERLMELAFGDMVCGYGALIVMPPEASTVSLTDEDRKILNHPLGVNPWKDGERQIPAVEPTPLVDVDPTMPRARYLEPGTWFWDRAAFTLDEAEYICYDTTHNIYDLLKEAEKDGSGWRLEILKNIHTAMGDSKRSKAARDERDRQREDYERDRVTLRNLICYTAEIEGEERPDGHNAVAYVLWSTNGEWTSANWVKDPAWFFTPPFPNIALFYQHMVGEDATPFSALTANKTKVDGTDAIYARAYELIKEMKRGWIAEARHKETAQRIEDMEDGEVIIVPHLSDAPLQEIQKGGLDAPTIAAIQLLDQKLMEDLGMAAAGRGGTSGDTATENEIADEKSSMLVRQFRRAFNRGAADLFRIYAWYAGHDARFVVRTDVDVRAADKEREMRGMVGENDAARGARRVAEQTQALWQGGDFANSTSLNFNAFRFSIDAQLQRSRSMEENRIEASQFRADLFQILDGWLTKPFFNFMGELRRLEEDYGRRGLVELLDANMLSLMTQAQIEQGAGQAQMERATPSHENQGAGGPRMTVMNGPVMGRSETLRRAASNNE